MLNYSHFYDFIIKRETIRLKKELGYSAPWTDDEILQNYKFTNVKREHDTTTKKFCEVLYNQPSFKEQDSTTKFLNCILARHIGTWEALEDLGVQTGFYPKKIRKKIMNRMDNGIRTFTGAYMLPAYGDTDPKIDILIRRTLTPYWEQYRFDILDTLERTNRWEDVLKVMSVIHGFGGSQFMAKEVLLDTILAGLWKNGGVPDDFNTYCPVGPGAERGLNRLAGRDTKKSIPFPQKLEEMIALFEARNKYLPPDFIELCLHDIQFQLCEFDKYQRVLLGEGRPRSKYNGRGVK